MTRPVLPGAVRESLPCKPMEALAVNPFWFKEREVPNKSLTRRVCCAVITQSP